MNKYIPDFIGIAKAIYTTTRDMGRDFIALCKEANSAVGQVALEFNFWLANKCNDFQSLSKEELERRYEANKQSIDVFYEKLFAQIEEEKRQGKWVPTEVERGTPDLRNPIYEPSAGAVLGFLALFCAPALLAGLCSLF